MRIRLRTTVLSLLALGILLVMSCAPNAVSIADRIGMFVSSINSGGSSTYQDCNPSATYYNASKSASYWTAYFPSTPYSSSNLNDTNSAAVTVTLTGTGGPGTYTFGMVNSPNMGSDNWLIRTIKDPLNTTIFQ